MNPPLTTWQRIQRAGSSLPFTQTFTYYTAFIALGMTTASLGPTLLGLSAQTGSPLNEISVLFTARALGYLLGSFVGGRLYDRLPGHRTMAGALVVIGLLLATVPTIPLVWLLTFVLLSIGFMEAIVDVGANTLIVWVHREKVAPFMNGLHLFFAIGALLAPLLFALSISVTGDFRPGYWVLSLLLLPVVLLFLPLPSPEAIVSRAEHVQVHPPLLLFVLVVLFFATIAGAESSFGGWIYTYGVKTNLLNQETAAIANSAFWGAFMLGRLASIPLAARMRPRMILLTDLLLAFAGVGVILVFSFSVIALWLGIILFGLGIASAFPTLLTFAGRHMTITGAVTGWFFVGASLGSMTMPWLIGQLFESVSAMSVLWVIGGSLTLGFAAFGLILVYLRRQAPQ